MLNTDLTSNPPYIVDAINLYKMPDIMQGMAQTFHIWQYAIRCGIPIYVT